MITGNFQLADDEVLELQTQLQSYDNRATDYHDSEISARARMGYEYYNKELPKPINSSASKYVSADVWDGVNGVLQELISTFASNEERAVKFTPLFMQDGLGAEAATELVNKVLLQLNPGYNVMHDSFKEALITRNGWMKCYWKNWHETTVEEFDGITREQLDQYLANIKGELVSLDTETTKVEVVSEGTKKSKRVKQEGPELLKGRVVYRTPKEGVKVEYIPFEEITLDPTARSLCDTNYICHRVRKSKQELIDMGFDKDKVDGLPTASLDIEGTGVAIARSGGLQPRATLSSVHTGDTKADKVWLKEAYIKSSIGSDYAQLLQTFSCNGEVLEVNLVDSHPFHTFTPFPIPGQVWGESLFDILKEIQDIKSFLRRGMIDNINNANFRRYKAKKGAFDRQSLLNNRPGGVIEILGENTMDSVIPMDHHQIPNGVTDLLAMVDYDKESRTGTSKVSQGLDPNVFKNDNSTATVGMVMTAALNRMRMIARNVANYGWIPLCKSIYDLYRQYGTEPIQVETSRGIIELNPKMLPERSNLSVAMAVGPAEKAEKAAKLQQALMMFTQVPQMQMFFQPANAYEMAKDILEAQGFGDVSQYLTPLDQLPPPQPDPTQQAQALLMQKQVEQIDASNQKIIADTQRENARFEFEQQKAADEMHQKEEQAKSEQDRMADATLVQQEANEIARERLKLDHRKLDIKEKEMLIQAQMENGQQRPIALHG